MFRISPINNLSIHLSLTFRPSATFLSLPVSPTDLPIMVQNYIARYNIKYAADSRWYCFAQPHVWSHIVFNNEAMNLSEIRNQRRIKIWVALVLTSWSLSYDKLEWYYAIGTVDDLNLLNFSSATYCIEIYLKPDMYWYWTCYLRNCHISAKSRVHFKPYLLRRLSNMAWHLPYQLFLQ